MSARCLAGIGILLAGCSARERVVGFQKQGTTVDAGQTFTAPVLITGLLDPADEIQDPTLSPDELEMYFASLKNGSYDIWRSTRVAIGAPWVAGVLVQELATSSADYEPDLSYDGLTLYFSSDRSDNGTSRIWVSQRSTTSDPWGAPSIVNLGTTSADRGPAVDVRGLLMVFAANHNAGDFDLYSSTRTSTTVPWGAPANITEVNSSVFDWDPAIYGSGLGLVFGSRRNGDKLTSDLFETTRASESTPYDTPRALVELNSPMSEGDPWLSNDGRHVVFSSDRSGISQLYEAWR